VSAGVDVTSHQLDAGYESKVDNEVWVHFWNVAYQEVRGRHVGAYLKDANGVIVVFDSTDLKSIQAVDEWRLAIEQHLPTASEGRRPPKSATKDLRPIPMILVANKADFFLVHQEVWVSELGPHLRQGGDRGTGGLHLSSGDRGGPPLLQKA